MKKLLTALLFLCPVLAYTQTGITVRSQIATDIINNSTRVITPLKVRNTLNKMVDYIDTKASSASPIFTGTIGINTTSPIAPLHVKLATNQNIIFSPNLGSFEAGTPSIIALNDDAFTPKPLGFYAGKYSFLGGNFVIGSTVDNGNKFQITGNSNFTGSVGVGTSAPGPKFEVMSGVTNNEIVRFSGTSSGRGLSITSFAVNGSNETGYNFNAPGSGGSGGLSFSVLGVEAVRINSIGNVGIGTIAPTSTLHAAGSQSGTLLSTAIATTLANQRFVVVTAAVALTLPVASTTSGRFYTINARVAGVTISSYFDLAGIAQTTIASGTAIVIVSDGTNWQRVE